ncbi:hypothetical protein [Novacetimonas pomaceti]|nr:hypothetical protein [Novacetimonas pomaceti]
MFLFIHSVALFCDETFQRPGKGRISWMAGVAPDGITYEKQYSDIFVPA